MPKKVKLSLLDEDLGKIQGVPPEGELPLGSLISYWATPKGEVHFLSGIEVLFVPLELGRHDILFLHHVLEMCYYFIPVNGTAPGIFSLLDFLYAHNDMMHHIRGKKIFLFKLFATLGIYPEHPRFHTSYFYRLATESIDTLLAQEIDMEGESMLDDWLAACVAIHPYVHHFKTGNFLTQSRIL